MHAEPCVAKTVVVIFAGYALKFWKTNAQLINMWLKRMVVMYLFLKMKLTATISVSVAGLSGSFGMTLVWMGIMLNIAVKIC
mmetsp:Transcript_9782/g.12769  ORF Transcript_9782/g.12769 Transcript_9782/m.12769 type:complete len:82 (+) Transcript_9782:669-914(+)